MASSTSSNSFSKLKSIMDTTSPDWSTLTKDLLISIANRLDLLGDTLRFRAVCKTFQSSIPAPKPLSPPRSDLNIPFPFEKHRHSGGHFVVTSSTVYAFKPLTRTHETNQTWLVRAQKSPSGKVRIQNPLFEIRLQLYTSSHNLPQSLNLLDYHVKEIDKAYHLELVSSAEGKPLLDFFRKVVASTCNDESDTEFSIMALHFDGTILIWRNLDKKWTSVDIPCGKVMDIVYDSGKFYLVFTSGITVTVEPISLTITGVAGALKNQAMMPAQYLIKSLENLLMVGTFRGYGTFRGKETLQLNEFYIYKLDQDNLEWVAITKECEKRMLFLSEDHSFSASDDDFSGCEGNTIYYTYFDYSFLIDNLPSVGTFHLREGFDVPNYSRTFLHPSDWLN